MRVVESGLEKNFAEQLIDGFLEGIDTAEIIFSERRGDPTRDPVVSIVPCVGFSYESSQFAVYKKFIKLENGAYAWIPYEVHYKGIILVKSQLPVRVIQYLIENRFSRFY